MYLNHQETADLVTFTEEIIDRKLNFCAGSIYKGANHTLQYMPNKNHQPPRSFSTYE